MRKLHEGQSKEIVKKHKRGVGTNVVAIHADTGIDMINQHYQDMTDDNLLVIHKRLHPKRNTNNEH
jgi:hypothetical protein